LFLNAWVGDPLLSPGVTDEISYGPIVTALDDNYLVPELLRILNEIKEAFATARYVFFLSQRKTTCLMMFLRTRCLQYHKKRRSGQGPRGIDGGS